MEDRIRVGRVHSEPTEEEMLWTLRDVLIVQADLYEKAMGKEPEHVYRILDSIQNELDIMLGRD